MASDLEQAIANCEEMYRRHVALLAALQEHAARQTEQCNAMSKRIDEAQGEIRSLLKQLKERLAAESEEDEPWRASLDPDSDE